MQYTSVQCWDSKQATMPTTPRIVEKCVWWMNSPEYGERKLTSDLVSPLIYYPTGCFSIDSQIFDTKLFLILSTLCTFYFNAIWFLNIRWPHVFDTLWIKLMFEAKDFMPKIFDTWFHLDIKYFDNLDRWLWDNWFPKSLTINIRLTEFLNDVFIWYPSVWCLVN